MTPGALAEQVEHFRHRVLADALKEATSIYWQRRATAFEAAMPKSTDFTGNTTEAEIVEQRDRLAETAAACRARASVSLIHDDLIVTALKEVA